MGTRPPGPAAGTPAVLPSRARRGAPATPRPACRGARSRDGVRQGPGRAYSDPGAAGAREASDAVDTGGLDSFRQRHHQQDDRVIAFLRESDAAGDAIFSCDPKLTDVGQR
jgi:hypothetical protein